MAKPILEALTLIFEEELVKLPYRPYTMLSMANKRLASQRAIKWQANVGGAVTNGRAITSDAGLADNTDIVKPAEIPIGGRVLNHVFSLLLTDIKEARSTALPALRDLFASHLNTAVDVILPKLNQNLFTGVGGANSTDNGVFGLTAVTNNAQPYAGIDPAVDMLWQANNINSGVPRPLTRDLLSEVEISVARKGAPYDVIVTTPEIVEVYGKVFIQMGSLGNPQINGTVDLGFSGYEWKGRPIITDIDCPAGNMYFLSSRDLAVYTYDFSAANPEIAVTKNLKNTNGLQYMISQLNNRNPHLVEFEVSIVPQMKVHNRKSVTVINNIDQSLAAYAT